MFRRAVSLSLLLALSAASVAEAQIFTPVAFTGNMNLQFINSAYPSGPVTLGGVPFNIPASGNNIWHSHVADGGDIAGNNGGNGAVVSLTIPVNVFGVTEVDTLINTYWGQANSTSVSLQFTGSGGATYTKTLVGNSDIRDYYEGTYTHNLNNTTSQQVFFTNNPAYFGGTTGSRLDKQAIALPEEFLSQTLTFITLTDSGAGFVQRSFLSGITVNAVPAPNALAAFVLGAVPGAMALSRRRRRKA